MGHNQDCPYGCILVDDDIWALRDLETIFPFSEYGFVVKGTYRNAADAFEAIREIHPALVITDICLGGKSGLELIDDCRRLGYEGEFLIISGYSEFDYARHAIKQDVCTYLLKPIDADECREALKKVQSRLQNRQMTADDTNRTDDIRRYIREHYRERLSLDDIADAFHMNRTYFSEFFMKSFGKNFVQYKNEVRIEQAKTLLQDKSIAVRDVSSRCGFESAGYFSSVFKQATGLSPEQYRKEKD